MYQLASQAYLDAMKATTREIRAYLRFNDSTNLRGCDGLISIDWHSNLFDEPRPTFGCCVSSYIEAKFYDNNISGIAFETAYVNMFIGCVLEDTGTAPIGSIEPDTATVEYVPCGRYYVTNVKHEENIVTITAYDNLYKLNKNYVPTVTKGVNGYAVKDIVNDIYTQCSLGYNAATSNYGYVDTVYEGTCREQLGWMSPFMNSNGVCFAASRVLTTSFAVVDPVVRWNQYGYYVIDDTMIYMGGFDHKPDYTISSITSGTEETPIVAGNGVGLARENPNITQALVDSIYSALGAKTFVPMTVNFRGDPIVDVGDFVKVSYKGTDYRCWVHSIHTIFNGGLSSEIECYGDSEATYQMSTSPTSAKIQIVKDMVGEIAEKIDTGDKGYCTKVYDQYGNWVELVISNLQDYTTSESVWLFNDQGIGHKYKSGGGAYSGGTYTSALDNQGRFHANIIQTGILQGTGSYSYWDFDNDVINLAGTFTMTGGTINIATTSGSFDVITLSYSGGSPAVDYTTTLSPQGLILTETVGNDQVTLFADGLTITDTYNNRFSTFTHKGIVGPDIQESGSLVPPVPMYTFGASGGNDSASFSLMAESTGYRIEANVSGTKGIIITDAWNVQKTSRHSYDQINFGDLTTNYHTALSSTGLLVENDTNNPGSSTFVSDATLNLINGTDQLIINELGMTFYQNSTVTTKYKSDGYLKNVITTAANYTLNSNGYASVTKPAEVSGARKIVSADVYQYTSSTGAFAVSGYNGNLTTAYVFGEPGVVISDLRIQFWYLDDE